MGVRAGIGGNYLRIIPFIDSLVFLFLLQDLDHGARRIWFWNCIGGNQTGYPTVNASDYILDSGVGPEPGPVQSLNQSDYTFPGNVDILDISPLAGSGKSDLVG